MIVSLFYDCNFALCAVSLCSPHSSHPAAFPEASRSQRVVQGELKVQECCMPVQ